MLSLSVFLFAYPCSKVTYFLLPSPFYKDEETMANGQTTANGKTHMHLFFSSKQMNENYVSFFIPVLIGDKKTIS